MVTGGANSLKRVVAYNSQGMLEDTLPDLLSEYQGHACGYYTNTDGQFVSGLNMTILFDILPTKTVLFGFLFIKL